MTVSELILDLQKLEHSGQCDYDVLSWDNHSETWGEVESKSVWSNLSFDGFPKGIVKLYVKEYVNNRLST